MSKHFRIVGYLSLGGVVASSVEIIVMMAKNVSNYTFFFYLMLLIFAVIFGSAQVYYLFRMQMFLMELLIKQ